MPKPNPLQAALKGGAASARVAAQAAEAVAPVAVEAAGRPVRGGKASREGRVMVAGFFAPEVQTALKVLAAQEGSTVQALLAEGIDAVFAKRGKPEIAALPPSGAGPAARTRARS